MRTIITHYDLQADWKQKKTMDISNVKKESRLVTPFTNPDKNQVTQQDNPQRHGPVKNEAKLNKHSNRKNRNQVSDE